MFPSPHFSTVVLGGLTILNAGTEEQKSEFLRKIVNGGCIMALALTEPETSWNGRAWDPDGVTMRARQDGDDYTLNGVKLFVHDAAVADYLLVVARTRATRNPANGVTLFLVDAKDPGIKCTLLQTIAGDKQCEVVFKNVRVNKKNIIGQLHGGWPPIAQALKSGGVILAAQMLGAAQKLLELTVDYAKTRVQFDMPIGINQYIQEHCVNLYTDMDGIKWSTYYAAWKLDKGDPADFEAAVAKGWASDAYERICWYAHQVFAGIGYTVNDGVVPDCTHAAARSSSFTWVMGHSTRIKLFSSLRNGRSRSDRRVRRSDCGTVTLRWLFPTGTSHLRRRRSRLHRPIGGSVDGEGGGGAQSAPPPPIYFSDCRIPLVPILLPRYIE